MQVDTVDFVFVIVPKFNLTISFLECPSVFYIPDYIIQDLILPDQKLYHQVTKHLDIEENLA